MAKINKTILISLVVIFLLSAGFAFAQFDNRNLEVPLPGLGDTKIPILPDYVKYIFNFAIGIGGLIAFLALIYGGVRYLTSAGNPSAIGDAKDQIFSALLGVILLVGSWLILTTINPQLTMINPQKEGAGLTAGNLPGVYLCKIENGKESCLHAPASLANVGGAFEDKITSIKIVNPDASYTYGAVLHEAKDYGWTCKEFTSNQTIPQYGSKNIFPGDGVSSATVFPWRTSGSDCTGVTLYDDINLRGKSITVPVYGQDSLGEFGEKARSIQINGTCQVLLFRNAGYQGVCETTASDVMNLLNHPVTIREFLGSDLGGKIAGVFGAGDINTLSSIKIIPR